MKSRLKFSMKNLGIALVTGALGLLTVGLGVAAAGGQDATPVKEAVWKPDAKLMRYMGRQVAILSYSLQPPASYALNQTRRDGLLMDVWQGQQTPTGFAPNIAIAIAPVPVRANKKLTAEQLLTGALDTLHRGHTDWTQTEIEHGQINGLAFVRAYWSGIEQNQKQKRRGVSYVTIDGDNAISLLSQDKALGAGQAPEETLPDSGISPDGAFDNVLPTTLDRLKLAETAIQTLHRVAPPRKTPTGQ